MVCSGASAGVFVNRPPPTLVPCAVSRERLEQRRRVRVINRHGGHRFGRRRCDVCQSRIIDVVLERIEHHRADVGGRRLKKVAEQLEVMLDVAQPSGVRHKAQQRGQTLDQTQILRVPLRPFLTRRPHLFAHPPGGGLDQTRRATPRATAFFLCRNGVSRVCGVASGTLPETQASHPRPPHQLRHTVDDDHRAPVSHAYQTTR